MSKKRKRYSDDFRASAVLMLAAAGYPQQEGALKAVSNKLNVPHPTLHRWYHRKQNPPPSDLVHKKKRDLLKDITELLFKHIDAAGETLETAEHNHVMTGLGILFDKRQLLENKPTAILKLQEAIENGKITKEQAAERWPDLMRRYDTSISA